MIRASIADQSDQTKSFFGRATRAGRTSRASLRATGTSTGAAAASVGMAAAVGDHVDELGLVRAILAEDVTAQVLDLDALARGAAGLPGAGETILIANDAVDLLRDDAGEISSVRPRRRRGVASQLRAPSSHPS